VAEEATSISERVLDRGPDVTLVTSWSVLSDCYRDAGILDDALAAAQLSAQRLRGILDDGDEAALLPLARILTNVAGLLLMLERPGDAIGPAREATDAWRRLGGDEGAPGAASALHTLGLCYVHIGEPDDALAAAGVGASRRRRGRPSRGQPRSDERGDAVLGAAVVGDGR
jgi:Tetratricopeptide repeat